jgi:hypothetical protein
MAVQKTVTTERRPLTTSTTTKKAVVVENKPQPLPSSTLFSKDNYKWMAIGAIVVALGFILMSGGKNEDPNTFNYDVVYSTRRITIAPILIVAGLIIEIYAIFKRPKQRQV